MVCLASFTTHLQTFLPLIEENGDIIPDTTDIIWLPFSIKCRAIIDDDLITLFKANPYGVIRGTINGNVVEFLLILSNLNHQIIIPLTLKAGCLPIQTLQNLI